jgi:hypothetical protein
MVALGADRARLRDSAAQRATDLRVPGARRLRRDAHLLRALLPAVLRGHRRVQPLRADHAESLRRSAALSGLRLTGAELDAGEAAWRALPDPFG